MKRSFIPALLAAMAMAAPCRAVAPALGAWDALSAGAEGASQAAGATAAPDGYVWWRATATTPREGLYRLRVAGPVRPIAVYVNGVASRARSGGLLSLKRGRNQIAFLAASEAGSLGAVTLSASAVVRTPVETWRWTKAANREAAERMAARPSGPDAADWKSARSGETTLGASDRWAVYTTALPAALGGGDVAFEAVDDNATVYLNGRRVGEHSGWEEAFEVSLDAAWKNDAPNVLTVVVENTGGQGGITGPVEVQSYAGEAAARPLAGASVRAGLAPPDERAGWQPFTIAANGPAFYRTHFTLAADAPTAPLTLETGYLAKGLAWVNGRLVGQYPAGSGLSRLALPKDALRPGRNTLILFDEQGRAPTGARFR